MFRVVSEFAAGGGHGSIVLISSTAGLRGEAGASAYCASKFGLIGLAESLAAELAGKCIRVNAVCPGNVDTPMLQEAVRQIAEYEGVDASAVRDRLARDGASRRLVRPDEVAAACWYLCSDGAAAITGTFFGSMAARWSVRAMNCSVSGGRNSRKGRYPDPSVSAGLSRVDLAVRSPGKSVPVAWSRAHGALGRGVRRGVPAARSRRVSRSRSRLGQNGGTHFLRWSGCAACDGLRYRERGTMGCSSRWDGPVSGCLQILWRRMENRR